VFLLENLALLFLGLLAAVAAVNLVFLFLVVYRRLASRRFYLAKDAAHHRYSPTIDSFLQENLGVKETTAVLITGQSEPEQAAIQELVLSRITADNVHRATELLFALGMVERWMRQIFGKQRAVVLLECALRRQRVAPRAPRRPRVANVVRRLRLFWVPRSVALAHLGNLDPDFVQPMLADALLDPVAEVRRIAVFSLGLFPSEDALPLLFEELRQAAEGSNDISLRTVKAALTGYPLTQVSAFVPCLKHPHTRVRFFALNIAAGICARAAATMVLNKNDFSPEFYSAVLELTGETSADLRAQSADVVQHFGDAGATGALRRLLDDENEFVRLHAVRAAGRYIELMPDLVRRLCDSRWRVREAAVKTIAGFGPTGINELYRHFATTSDVYSCDQIADEIQRAGIIRDLVAGLASAGGDHDLAVAACNKMVRMGKTSMLITALATSHSPEIRVPLMYALMAAPSQEVLAVVGVLAESGDGAVRETASSLLRKMPRGGAA